MPTLKRRYPGLKFSLVTIKAAIAKYEEIHARWLLDSVYQGYGDPTITFVVALDSGDEWEIENREEFYDFYRAPEATDARITSSGFGTRLEFAFSKYMGTEVTFPMRTDQYSMNCSTSSRLAWTMLPSPTLPLTMLRQHSR
jgi:hypothetical protein